MGVTLSSGGRAVASHRCAAALHGMDGFSRSMVGWQATKRPADLLALVVETARHRRSLVA